MKELLESGSLVQLESLLENLELRVDYTLDPNHKFRILNLAGDVCFDAGQAERALCFYERALHTLIAGQLFDSAALLCKKIVALRPDAITACATLAWLALVRGTLTEARNRIMQYSQLAEAAGLTQVARSQLRSIARQSDANDVLECIAEALLDLDDPAGADAIFGRVHAGTAHS